MPQPDDSDAPRPDAPRRDDTDAPRPDAPRRDDTVAPRRDDTVAPRPDDTVAQRLVIVVVRSGGIGGMSREWRAEADLGRETRWRDLVDSCPWDTAPPPTRGPDRFQWRIEVHAGAEPVHQARLSDTQVSGPWRTLVDEVREAAPPRAAR